MTTPTLIVIIVGGSLWLSMMIVTVITASSFRKALKIVAPLVCRRGEKMTLFVGKASYHRPGERGLLVQCEGIGGSRIVTIRTVLLAWMALAIIMMIIGAVVAVVAMAIKL